MHDGCSGQFDNGRQVADKVRMMGFDIQPMPMPLEIHCKNCEKTFTMQTFLASCPIARWSMQSLRATPSTRPM